MQPHPELKQSPLLLELPTPELVLSPDLCEEADPPSSWLSERDQG